MSSDVTPLQGLRSDLDALRRRLAEREPKFESHSMELLRCVLENAPDYVAMLAPDGSLIFLNRVREGAVLEKTLGTSAYDYQAPADRAAYRACVESVIRTGKPEVLESTAHLSNGTIVRFETRFGPVRDGDQVIAVTVIATDITASRHAAQALEESQAMLRMAIDTAGIGLWSWDSRANQAVWEDGLCAIFGLPSGNSPPSRQEFIALVHPDDRQRASDAFDRGTANGEWEDEYRIVRADGAIRWVMSKGTVLRAKNASLVAFGAFIDVTERKERDEERRQAQKMEAIGQLTAGIAHNFNNMLMGILPNLQLAAASAPPELLQLLASAEHSALRAADLVRQLMTYAGRSRHRSRSIESIGALVRRTVDICRTTFDRRIALEVRCDSLAPARVDAVQIEQAVLNLLINARDALADPELAAPTIAVDVELVPAGAPELVERPGARGLAHVRVRISDNGVGMERETLGRIYEPFFTTKEVGAGTGLGLATTHAIIREHAGWITCESAKRSGTTFAVYLPSEQAPVEPARREPDPVIARGTETILIIDDEPAIRAIVAMMLEGAGFSAKLASSGPEALRQLADQKLASKIALVLLDVSMPGMSARELRSQLRALIPQARIVYFTGYAFEAPDADDAVLEKPVTEARLLGTIREVLDRKQARERPHAIEPELAELSAK